MGKEYPKVSSRMVQTSGLLIKQSPGVQQWTYLSTPCILGAAAMKVKKETQKSRTSRGISRTQSFWHSEEGSTLDTLWYGAVTQPHSSNWKVVSVNCAKMWTDCCYSEPKGFGWHVHDIKTITPWCCGYSNYKNSWRSTCCKLSISSRD